MIAHQPVNQPHASALTKVQGGGAASVFVGWKCGLEVMNER